MKKCLLIASISCSLLFASCSRDKDKPKPSTADSVQLTVMVDSLFDGGVISQIDSTVFSYDDAGLLAEWRYVIHQGTHSYQQHFFFTRDGQGRPTRMTREDLIIDNGVAQPGPANIITDYHYNPASGQVDYYYEYPDGKGLESADSVALGYTGPYITDMRRYDLSGNTPGSSFIETAWTFDNSGQIATLISAAQDSTSPVYYTFESDGKINPLKLGVEALAADIYRMSSGNFVTGHGNWPAGSSVSQVNWSYTYRSDNRPLRATYTQSFAPDPRSRSFYYSR